MFFQYYFHPIKMVVIDINYTHSNIGARLKNGGDS